MQVQTMENREAVAYKTGMHDCTLAVIDQEVCRIPASQQTHVSSGAHMYIYIYIYICEQGRNSKVPLLSEVLQNKIHACKTR